ncbi:MAG TPA: hypothetical protein VMR70_00245 [Flavisolibacter sp.]|nr:hypothetical protein [Flavisolibacter sp.]
MEEKKLSFERDETFAKPTKGKAEGNDRQNEPDGKGTSVIQYKRLLLVEKALLLLVQYELAYQPPAEAALGSIQSHRFYWLHRSRTLLQLPVCDSYGAEGWPFADFYRGWRS